MWGTRRDLVRALVVTTSLGACFIVVIFSWPDKERSRVPRLEGLAPVAVVRTGIQGAEILPAVHQTGSIHAEGRPSVLNAALR
jgi:hypothetical protein